MQLPIEAGSALPQLLDQPKHMPRYISTADATQLADASCGLVDLGATCRMGHGVPRCGTRATVA